MFELCLCFCALSYEHPDFGNFKKKFQIILFVQEFFELFVVKLDTISCCVYFLYIYNVATYDLFTLILSDLFPSLNLYLICETFSSVPVYFITQ